MSSKQDIDDDVTGGIPTVSYVADGDGKQELKSGEMWQPVNVVNRKAWEEIERQVTLVQEQIAAGKVSRLCYYMVVNHMDTGLLAQYTGQSRLLVYFHTIPFFFKRLRAATLQKYAQVFQITVQDLVSGQLQPPVYGSDQGEEHGGDHGV